MKLLYTGNHQIWGTAGKAGPTFRMASQVSKDRAVSLAEDPLQLHVF